jgi:hypothetical protein
MLQKLVLLLLLCWAYSASVTLPSFEGVYQENASYLDEDADVSPSGNSIFGYGFTSLIGGGDGYSGQGFYSFNVTGLQNITQVSLYFDTSSFSVCDSQSVSSNTLFVYNAASNCISDVKDPSASFICNYLDDYGNDWFGNSLVTLGSPTSDVIDITTSFVNAVDANGILNIYVDADGCYHMDTSKTQVAYLVLEADVTSDFAGSTDKSSAVPTDIPASSSVTYFTSAVLFLSAVIATILMT